MQRQADTRARFHGAVESLVVIVGKIAVCVTPASKHEADRCSRATRDPRHRRIAGLRVSPTPPATVHDAYPRSCKQRRRWSGNFLRSQPLCRVHRVVVAAGLTIQWYQNPTICQSSLQGVLVLPDFCNISC